MKKLFAFSLLIFLCCPSVFAQKDLMRFPTNMGKIKIEVNTAMGNALANTMRTVAVKIDNLHVPLTDLATTVPSFSQDLPPLPDINQVPASILPLEQVRRGITSDFKIYLPFSVQEQAFYRGMSFNSIEDLRHILINGLEVSKTSYNTIYTATSPNTALWYAVHSQEELSYAEMMFGEKEDIKIPVLIRIPATPEMRQLFGIGDLKSDYFTFDDDIPSHLFEVFTFMKINDRTGWYQVVLSPEGEVVFIPMSSHEIPGRIYW